MKLNIFYIAFFKVEPVGGYSMFDNCVCVILYSLSSASWWMEAAKSKWMLPRLFVNPSTTCSIYNFDNVFACFLKIKWAVLLF